MINLPPILPERGPFKKLFGWLNQLRAVVASQAARPTINGELDRTAVGTYLRPRSVTTTGGTTVTAQPVQPLGMVFRGEWNSDLDYANGDVTMIPGSEFGGLFIASALAPKGTPAPNSNANVVWIQIGQGFIPRFWK